MPSKENKVIIACAGAGKTTRLVEEALAHRERRIAIVTYTHNNLQEITNKFGKMNSGVPEHVDVMTWFAFLLRECARPYQRVKYDRKRIESFVFMDEQSALFTKEEDTARYYFAHDDRIYSDKIGQFAIECEKMSGNAVTDRLGEIYTDLFIDEFQDLAGWDLNVIEMFLRSGLRITLVGDPRQCVYTTNRSRKNKQYRGIKVENLIRDWKKKGLCERDSMSGTYRCNQAICDFANGLWPHMDAMESRCCNPTDHDGVFLVAEPEVPGYVERFHPQILRHSIATGTCGYEALNFGQAKGLQFERVLIFPTGPISQYLNSGDINPLATSEGSRQRLHVAVTRARHSVAFVYEGDSKVVQKRWQQGEVIERLSLF